MGVNDWGQPADGLDEPELSAWAESVAAVVNNSDVPVDSRVAAKVSKAGDVMTGNLSISRSDATASLSMVGNPSITEQRTAAETSSEIAINHIFGTVRRWKIYSNNGGYYLQAYDASGASVGVAIQISNADARVYLAADPIAALGAATKRYVDTADAGKVSKSGDTMTGALTVIGPVGDSPRIFMTEDTRTAQLTTAGNPINLSARNADNTDYVPIRCATPTSPVHAATKGYVDGIYTGFTPSLGGITLGNGTFSGRYRVSGKTVFATYLLRFGSTTTVAGSGVVFGFPTATNAQPLTSMTGVAITSGGTALLVGRATSGTQFNVNGIITDGKYSSLGQSWPVPFTENSEIQVGIVYETP